MSRGRQHALNSRTEVATGNHKDVWRRSMRNLGSVILVWSSCRNLHYTAVSMSAWDVLRMETCRSYSRLPPKHRMCGWENRDELKSRVMCDEALVDSLLRYFLGPSNKAARGLSTKQVCVGVPVPHVQILTDGQHIRWGKWPIPSQLDFSLVALFKLSPVESFYFLI